MKDYIFATKILNRQKVYESYMPECDSSVLWANEAHIQAWIDEYRERRMQEQHHIILQQIQLRRGGERLSK